MAWDFTVDSDIQLDMASILKGKADELDQQFANLYSQIGSLGQHWVGSDYDAFNTGCSGYKQALADLTDSVRMYATHFEKVAEGTDYLSADCIAIVQNMTTRGDALPGSGNAQGGTGQGGTGGTGGTGTGQGGTGGTGGTGTGQGGAGGTGTGQGGTGGTGGTGTGQGGAGGAGTGQGGAGGGGAYTPGTKIIPGATPVGGGSYGTGQGGAGGTGGAGTGQGGAGGAYGTGTGQGGAGGNGTNSANGKGSAAWTVGGVAAGALVGGIPGAIVGGIAGNAIGNSNSGTKSTLGGAAIGGLLGGVPGAMIGGMAGNLLSSGKVSVSKTGLGAGAAGMLLGGVPGAITGYTAGKMIDGIKSGEFKTAFQNNPAYGKMGEDFSTNFDYSNCNGIVDGAVETASGILKTGADVVQYAGNIAHDTVNTGIDAVQYTLLDRDKDYWNKRGEDFTENFDYSNCNGVLDGAVTTVTGVARTAWDVGETAVNGIVDGAQWVGDKARDLWNAIF